MYALASLWRSLGSVAIAWQAWDNRQGVGCTPCGVPWAPRLLRGRRGTISTAKGSDVRGRRGTISAAKGSDVRPGAPLAFLGLRRFCVAGVGQSPLPRGRLYAMASL